MSDYVLDYSGSYINENLGIIPALKSNFSNIEDGDTASKAYVIGDYITRNGALYKVIASIASGDNFTVGANISQTTISAEMQTMKDEALPVYGAGENILINADFRRPVNRNGLSSYNSSGYTIDRWMHSIDIGTISLDPDGGLIFDASNHAITFYQRILDIAPLIGNTLTLSVYYKALTPVSAATAIMTENSGHVEPRARMTAEANEVKCVSSSFTADNTLRNPAWLYVAYGEKIQVFGIKLELGSQQTLAHQENGAWVLNEPVNYEREYLRCLPYSPSTGEFVGVNYSNPNLLDNWYFAGGGSQQGGGQFPINQRVGYVLTNTATYYTDSALSQDPVTVSAYTTVYGADVHTNYVGFYLTRDLSGTKYYASRTDCVLGYRGPYYTIDRWYINTYGGYVRLEPDGLVMGFSGTVGGNVVFRQEAENARPAGTYTLSMLVKSKSGIWKIAQRDTIIDTDDGLFSYTFTSSGGSRTTYLWCNSAAGELKISAIKLELGSQQTLAHYDETAQEWVLNDPPPNFQQELAKCQRYQLTYGDTVGNWGMFRLSLYTANELYFFVPTPVSLRARPSASSLNADLQGNRIKLFNINSWTILTGFIVSDVRLAGGGIVVVCTKTNHGLQDAALQVLNSVIDSNL